MWHIVANVSHTSERSPRMLNSRSGAYGSRYTLYYLAVVHVCLISRTTSASAIVSDFSVPFPDCSGSRIRLLLIFFRLLSNFYDCSVTFTIAQYLFFRLLRNFSDCSAAFSDCSVPFSDCSVPFSGCLAVFPVAPAGASVC